MADTASILEKLRDPSPEGASARLAALLVEDALGQTVGDLLDIPSAAAALRDGLRAFAASDAAAARVVDTLGEAEKKLAAEKRTIATVVPTALRAGAHDLAAIAVTPPRDVIVKLLDREPLKKLLRAQVIDTLVAFGRKAASPVSDNPIARGIGGLGKFALGQATKPSALGAFANAVSGEVERQVEKRATDFADTAVAGILDGIADQLSDSARSKEQAAMRLALLDGFLELTGAQVAQLARGPIAERVAVARKTLAAWSAEATFEADVEAFVRGALAKDADRQLGEVLADLGLRDVVAARAKEIVHRRVSALVSAEPFAEWLRALVGK
ncbi:MAG: hypothetical protein ACLQBL_09365 [Polyangiaceae bacterium]